MRRGLLLTSIVLLALVLVGCNWLSFVDGVRLLAVSGSVLDENGAGVGGVQILVGDHGTAVTDASGNWSVNTKKGAVISIAEHAEYTFNPEKFTVQYADQTQDFLAIAKEVEPEVDPEENAS